MNTIDLERPAGSRNPPTRSLLCSLMSLATHCESRGLVLDWRGSSFKTVEDTEPDQHSPISPPPDPGRPLPRFLLDRVLQEIRALAGDDPASPEFGRFRLIADGKLVGVTVREAGSEVILRFDEAGPAGTTKESLDDRSVQPRRDNNPSPHKAPLIRLPVLLVLGPLALGAIGIAYSFPWYLTALLMALPFALIALLIGLIVAYSVLYESHRRREFRRIPSVQATRKPLSARDFAAACDPPVPIALVDRVREALAANDECRASMRKITIDPARIRPDDGLVPPTRLRPTSDQIKKFCSNLEEVFEVPISPEGFRRARTVSGVVRLIAGQLAGTEGIAVP